MKLDKNQIDVEDLTDEEKERLRKELRIGKKRDISNSYSWKVRSNPNNFGYV